MKVTLATQTIIELKNNLNFQLAYGHPGHNEKTKYLKDYVDRKLQYCLDKNLEILDKEVERIEKITGVTALLEKFREKYEKAIKNLKTDNAIQKVSEKTDKEFFKEKEELLKENTEYEIDLYELKMEMPDVDRAGFWILNKFISQEENK